MASTHGKQPPELNKTSCSFFYKRNDGLSIHNTKMDRILMKSKLPAFDFDKHWQNNRKDGRMKVNKFLEKTLQNPYNMSKLINEMKLSGIDVDAEKLQHSKYETRSLHNYNMRSVYQSQDAKGVIG